MALTTYTLDELRDILLAHLRGRLPGANTAPLSEYWHLATILAIVANGNQAQALYLAEQVLPTTAERAFLDAHARTRGIDRAPATASLGKALLTGTAVGPTIAIGSVLTHASGKTYQTTSLGQLALPGWAGSKAVAPGTTLQRMVVSPDATGMAVDDTIVVGGQTRTIAAVLPETGTPIAVDFYLPLATLPSVGDAITGKIADVVEVLADVAGADGNLPAGDTLTLSSPPTNVDATATVLELSGGGDIETDAELRARVLAFMSERPGSGNRAHYREWARETPGVRLADAFVYPAYRGLGSVDVVPFGVSGTRQTGSAVNARIQAEIVAQASEHDDALVRQIVNSSPLAVSIQVRPHPGYEPDWSGSYTTHGTQASASQVKLTAVPDAIELGDRVLVKAGTSAPRLYQRTVIGKLAGEILVLDEALPVAPTASESLVAGGPLVDPILEAIESLFDAFGPGDSSPPSRWPGTDVWPATLRHALVIDTLMDLGGIETVTVTAPASDTGAGVFVRLTLGQLSITWV